MAQPQRIVRERRQYNQWVNSQTLEDYALRYTADSARKSSFRVGNTAFGPIAFLACEAIGGAITLAYGFPNAAAAIFFFAGVMFAIGLPIAYYAAKYGVDIDLLTRGAGFGYMGSTITSLIYASFTFLLFAIEASILSMALTLLFDMPLWVAHLCSALVVIPIAIYGISLISKIQMLTQPVWLLLQFIPIAYIVWRNPSDVSGWTQFTGKYGASDGSLTFILFGTAASVLLSLLPQIGEQVDYLRFLPKLNATNKKSWWTAVIVTGPGWMVVGGFKLLVGSFLAYFAIQHGVALAKADQPTEMYLLAFKEWTGSPAFALLLMGLFVIVCQIKINVTNAYAGSIAWSNFFSRLTHAHPGRVVWLVFNVILALLLMELGIFRAIEKILNIYANFAAGWIGALVADLVINKPLGLSPKHIEFKRAHLYDINPVGVGALLFSILLSSIAFFGGMGEVAQVLSPFIALLAAFIAAPIIAWLTDGRYYLARSPDSEQLNASEIRCSICENTFDRADVAMCPAYNGPICSLCCTLEARCRDMCKTDSRFTDQLYNLLSAVLPKRIVAALNTRAGHFFGLLLLFNVASALLLALIYQQYGAATPAASEAIRTTLWLVYFSLLVLSGVVVWLVVLAHESRRAAEAESARQTSMLMEEIEAHQRTDAELQKSKEVAEAANIAKTRYIVGMSHEIRTPLNSIFGYAQLLERGMVESSGNAVRVIRRSAEHMTDLIDGLMDISRIENGLLRLNRDKVQLVEFLDQLVDMFRLQAEAKGIEFRYQRPPHLPLYVHTDQKRLRQILINLLSNAIKYTESGYASLTVRYRSQVAEFEIADSGMGIPADDLERVFQPFERGSLPNAQAIPGTGLGLTITKLLTQIMGGELLARSVMPSSVVTSSESTEHGTTFTVRMLLSEARHESVALESPRHIRGYAGPRRSILLIDDDVTHLDIMRETFEPLGFDFKVATDGVAGITVANVELPDMILMDISMPNMTGWEVAKVLRQNPALTRTKIVMVSANAHEFNPGGEESLHDAFVLKPVDVHVLLECIATLLSVRWTYADEREPVESAKVNAQVPHHARHHIDDLYRLGRIGHVRGIQSKLNELEAVDPAVKPFAAHLRSLIANFDLKRYMQALEAMRRDN
jgi:signal transduction histidine kinase/CheY-like chemotaxis protein